MENIENLLAFDNLRSKSLKDYILLIRNNILLYFIITSIFVIGAVIFAVSSTNIYSAKTILKINKSGGNILQSALISQFDDYGINRFIANEVEIIKSNKLRKRVAAALTDSLKQNFISGNHIGKGLFYNIVVKEFTTDSNSLKLLPVWQISALLPDYVNIEQKPGVDLIVIEVESPSSYECALIGNIYARIYKNLNLEFNRNQLTFVKEFLNTQKQEKQNELREWEDTLKKFQEKGGIISLNEQAAALIGELSSFEAKSNAAMIELMASDEVLAQYKNELVKQDPALADYLESIASETYITALQQQVAEIQINKDLAIIMGSKLDFSDRVKEYDRKINELNNKLKEKISVIKAGIFASSPAQVKELSQKIIEEEVKNRSLRISINGLKTIVHNYEKRFNKLPRTSIELARFQRGRESLEKLYILIEEKYQEALINEQSQPGNVLIIDEAERPILPSKPNRVLIIIIGFMAGAFISFMFLLIREYFDTRVKTPEDLEKENMNLLGWVPQIKGHFRNGKSGVQLLNLMNSEESIHSEAFRSLRTRIQFTMTQSNSLRTLLITSAAPQEGKTFVSINLAKSFSLLSKKTLIIDCDLRRPRIHSIFSANRSPGLVDYLLNKVTLEEVIHSAEIPNLYYITSGTATSKPAEILASVEMTHFLEIISSKFDYIILDSPPVIAITDSEILAKLADGTIMVVSSDFTKMGMLQKTLELMERDKVYIVGIVLNNFSYKRGYGLYYKYYDYVTDSSNGSILKRKKLKKYQK